MFPTLRGCRRLSLAAAILVATPDLVAQSSRAMPAELSAERAAFAAWLAQAPVSPYAALSAAPLDPAGAPVEVNGHEARIVERDGTPWIVGDGRARPLARNRPMHLGPTTVLISGEPPRSRVMLFGPAGSAPSPSYYDYDPGLVFAGALTPPAVPSTERVLTPDGVEVEATLAGTVSVDAGGRSVLRVLRMPDPATGESSLEVYFRDASSGAGSYPAGRFVTLAPLPNGRYRLDFNRARNPFCAYNAAYPCPAPWRGNTLAAAIRAGERYVAHP